MRYLLDADTVSYLVKQNRKVWQRAIHFSAQWAISSVTVWELRNWRSESNDPIRRLIEKLISDSQIISFDKVDALHASELKWKLRSLGLEYGTADVLIAGQAISKSLVLVSNNTKHFEKMPGLILENWLK